MRKYENGQEEKLVRVVCNQCKKELKVEDGYLKEGCFRVDYTFGYFSRKDGTRQQFDLCEDCYDAFVKSMKISPEQEIKNEVM